MRSCATTPAPGSAAADATHTLSDVGAYWLAGLLAHARGAAVFGTPTVNGFGRFKPNAMAPQSVVWGRDNRGAMLRVLGGAGDCATAHRKPHRRADGQPLPLHRRADPLPA